MKYAAFEDPAGTFRILKPVGWHVLPMQDLAERQFMFSDEEMSYQKLRNEGMSIKATFLVKIVQLSQSENETTLETASKQYMDLIKELYQRNGMKSDVRRLGAKSIRGLKGIEYELIQHDPEGDQREITFIAKKSGNFYVLTSAINISEEKKYQPIMEKMKVGFELLKPAPILKLKTFSNKDASMSIQLPEDWYKKEHVSSSSDQLFVSETEIKSESDIFKVGVTISKTKNAKKYFKGSINTDTKVTAAWAKHAILGKPDLRQKMCTYDDLKRYGVSSYLVERSFEHKDEFIQELHLIFTKDNTLYDLIFEAPVIQFEKYRPTFEKAIESLQIK